MNNAHCINTTTINISIYHTEMSVFQLFDRAFFQLFKTLLYLHSYTKINTWSHEAGRDAPLQSKLKESSSFRLTCHYSSIKGCHIGSLELHGLLEFHAFSLLGL